MAKRLLSLWGLYARMDWKYITQDPFTACVTVLCELVQGLAGLAGTALVAVRFGGVGALSAPEVLVLLAFHLFSQGLETLLFGGSNVISISRRIGRAQMDHTVVQPIPLWMQLLTEGFMPFSGCEKLLCGVAALWLFVPGAGIAVTPGWMLLLCVLTLSRVAIHIALAYIAGSAAFYSPVGCEEFSDVALSLADVVAEYPLSGMPRWLVGTLLTVLPLGALTYLPALILLGKVSAAFSAWPVLLALVLASLAQRLFQKGWKHYVNVGCARYKSMGHRS